MISPRGSYGLFLGGLLTRASGASVQGFTFRGPYKVLHSIIT